MAALRVLILMLCVLVAARVPAATAEFNPALATLATNPEQDGLLATGKALTGDVREDADVLITSRALAAEGGESPHARAVRVLAEEDFLSPGKRKTLRWRWRMGGEAVGGEAVGGEAVGGEAVGGEAVGGEAVGGEAVGGEAVGGEAVGGEAVGGEAVGGEAVGGEAVGGEAVGGEAVGGEAVGGEAVGGSNPREVRGVSD
ncbi:unnamed protein product [Closterium sp. Yama58-4]|nr:unnamed protein product [Closterium sp. Yama58-4]